MTSDNSIAKKAEPVTRREFEDFRQRTEKRERAFAAILGLDLAKIDSEG